MSDHYVAYAGNKVSLGAMRREYVPILMEHANDMRVIEGVKLRPPVTLEAEYEWYDGLAKRRMAGTDEVFAILLHTQDSKKYRYIGHTSLHHIMWPEGTAVTATLIFEEDYFEKGIGAETKMLLQHHAFHTKGLRKLLSEVKSYNARSLGHLLKCGYQIYGRRKEHHFDHGRYWDGILLEVFRQDWEELWEQYQKTGKVRSLSKRLRALVKKKIDPK